MKPGKTAKSSALIVKDKEGREQVVYRPLPHQLAFHKATTPNVLMLGTRGTGKALALSTPIPTPTGFLLMGALQVGETVFDETGAPTRVLAKSETHIDPTGTYRVHFDDGSDIVCGGAHQWFTITKSEKLSGRGGSVKTTIEIAQTLTVYNSRERNHRIPLCGAWQCDHADLPIDPYTLGVWLGNGNRGNGQFSSADPDTVNEVRAQGWTVTKLSGPYHYGVQGLTTALRQLDAVEYVVPDHGVCLHCHKPRLIVARGLCTRCYEMPAVRPHFPKSHKGFRRFTRGVLEEKRIPPIYLYASLDQRLALLHGLMDTDGYCNAPTGTVEFCNTSYDLANGVYILAISLGLKPTLHEGRATLNGRDIGPKWRVCWTDTLHVFRLRRKRDRLKTSVTTRQRARFVTDVERIDDEPLQCIEVDAPSHLYLAGITAIPTHNSLALRMDAILRCLSIPNFHALILRRTMPELQRSHLVFIGREMKALGGTFLQTTKVAKFPNGSTITFGHVEHERDILNFLSAQYGFVGFDELSTYRLNMFLQISASARVDESSPYMAVVRATSNPLGEGADWMKQWFCDKDVDPVEYPYYHPDDFEMQFSTLEDNPHLDRQAYAARLSNLPEYVRRAWLLGEFVTEGQYFTDFKPTIAQTTEVPGEDIRQPWHVIDLPIVATDEDRRPVDLGNRSLAKYAPWLRIYRAVDWGYHPDPAVCLWLAVFPNSRTVVFKERHWKKTLASDVAKQIVRESAGMRVIDTFADPTMDVKAEYSIGEIFEAAGVPLTFAVNDRENYGYSINQYLNTVLTDGETRTPQLQIVRGTGGGLGCADLIRTIPLMRMQTNAPSELADGHDHWVVCLAYFCMGHATPARHDTRAAKPRWMLPKRRAYQSLYLN